MMTLSKSPELFELTGDPKEGITASVNYTLFPGDDGAGYVIRNKKTGTIEFAADQITSATMGLLWLQENYDDVMTDPRREYSRRKGMGQGIQPQGKIAH